MIQLVADDTVTSARQADDEWLAAHARIVDGKTVIDVGGEARRLPSTDLSMLIEQAASSDTEESAAADEESPPTTTPED